MSYFLYIKHAIRSKNITNNFSDSGSDYETAVPSITVRYERWFVRMW